LRAKIVAPGTAQRRGPRLADYIGDSAVAGTDEDDGVVVLLDEKEMRLRLWHFPGEPASWL